jgi:hypothetical protein
MYPSLLAVWCSSSLFARSASKYRALRNTARAFPAAARSSTSRVDEVRRLRSATGTTVRARWVRPARVSYSAQTRQCRSASSAQSSCTLTSVEAKHPAMSRVRIDSSTSSEGGTMAVLAAGRLKAMYGRIVSMGEGIRSVPGDEAVSGLSTSEPDADGVRFRFDMMEDGLGMDALLVVE